MLDERGTPTCKQCLSNVNFDVTIIWDEHFSKLEPAVRDTLLLDYVEELTANTLGADSAIAFWEHCFKGQPFFLTHRGSDEHERLWDTRRAAPGEDED